MKPQLISFIAAACVYFLCTFLHVPNLLTGYLTGVVSVITYRELKYRYRDQRLRTVLRRSEKLNGHLEHQVKIYRKLMETQ